MHAAVVFRCDWVTLFSLRLDVQIIMALTSTQLWGKLAYVSWLISRCNYLIGGVNRASRSRCEGPPD